MKVENDFLSNVCVIENGFAFKSINFKEGKGIPLLRISNINNEKVSFKSGTVYLGKDYLKKYEKFIVKKGDVVIALSGATTGKYGIYLLDTPCLLNQRIGLIRNNRSTKMDSRYFYFYLSILKSEILRKAQGAAQPNISTKEIGQFKIPLPPLAEQQKIAAILDGADVLRQKEQQLIDHYTTLSQSLFLDMFGDAKSGKYKSKTLETLFGKGEYGAGAKAVEYKENAPRYVRITDINEHGTLNTKKVSSDLQKKELGKYTLRKGDLVYAGYLIKFSIKEPYEPEYFFHFTKTSFYKAWIQKIQNVVAQPNINAKQYGRELGIPIPPITLQNQFADRIQHIEAQKQQAQASLEQSNNLFNSLLQKAFTGELTEEKES